MVATLLKLTEENKRKLDELARQTGKSQDVLVNEALRLLPDALEVRPACADWKRAIGQAAGMWKDRDDIPALMTQIKTELNRVQSPNDPS